MPMKFHFVPKQSPGGVLFEKVFIEMSQNWQEDTCVKVSFLIKLQAGRGCFCLSLLLYLSRYFPNALMLQAIKKDWPLF